MPTYSLELRECKCGCGGTFKVLPQSKDWYASITHRPDFSAEFFKKEMKIGYVRKVRQWIEEMYGENPDDPTPNTPEE